MSMRATRTLRVRSADVKMMNEEIVDLLNGVGARRPIRSDRRAMLHAGLIVASQCIPIGPRGILDIAEAQHLALRHVDAHAAFAVDLDSARVTGKSPFLIEIVIE